MVRIWRVTLTWLILVSRSIEVGLRGPTLQHLTRRLIFIFLVIHVAACLLFPDVLLHVGGHLEKIELVWALRVTHIEQLLAPQQLIQGLLAGSAGVLLLSQHVGDNEVLEDGKLLVLAGIGSLDSLRRRSHGEVFADLRVKG